MAGIEKKWSLLFKIFNCHLLVNHSRALLGLLSIFFSFFLLDLFIYFRERERDRRTDSTSGRASGKGRKILKQSVLNAEPGLWVGY